MLTQGTQDKAYGKNLVDFTPAILKDDYGHEAVIASENVPRDTWGIADFLSRHPYVLQHPETFEALNKKVQQEYWNFFDNPYGPGYLDKKVYKPTDPIIREIVDKHWDYFWYSTPQAGNATGRWTYLPWYDSNKLKEWFPDKNERTVVLLEFWDLPAYSVDMNRTDQEGVWIKVYGIQATKLFVEQLPKMYEIIDNAWKSSDRKEYFREYYGWLLDRGDHGMNNTVKQFTGLYVNEIRAIMKNEN